MRTVVATALMLFVLLFLCPMLLLQGEPLHTSTPPIPTATLPIHRPVATGGAEEEALVRVRLADGTVTTLSMADYLWRVVAAEMPASFESEALKAQAATARTYTLRKMESGVANHPDADVCADITCCQAYIDPAAAAGNWGDAAPMYTAKITEAVTATGGQAILYGGAPIDAVFFSSANRRTADAVEVWGGSVPYLAGVESPEGADVPNYHTTVTVPVADFKTAILSKYPTADLSGVAAEWFQNTVLTSAGGVDTVDVGGVAIKGTAIRSLFGLRSASFTTATNPESVTFSVTGYGHGVGMSQYGANTLAKEGKTWREILTWYYTGVTVAPYAAKSMSST